MKDSASVAALQDAIIAKLKLDTAPDCVRLLREVEGGVAVPLDSCEKLLDQGVKEGSKVFVEVIVPSQLSVTAALEGCRRLLAALRAAELEPIPASRSSLIRLPKGALWPQLGAEPLFVRDFYCGLYEGPLASCDPGCGNSLRKFILRGNAGIGKSAFGAYMLWRAIKAGRTVVYTSDKVETSFVFHSSGEVEAFSAEDFGRRTWAVLQQASTVFICDGVKPPVTSAFTVLITSPKRERYKEYFKLVDCEMLTVPVFFRHEIGDMLRTCFQHLVPQEALVWERYSKWGGIVRYVLAKQGQSSQNLLLASLTSIDLDDLIFHLGAEEIEGDDKASHRLLHLKPAGEVQGEGVFLEPYSFDSYALVRTELASKYVLGLVFSAMKQRHLQRLQSLLAQPIFSLSSAKLYGEVFERGAAAVLLKGGDFEAFDCAAAATVSVHIPPSTQHVFSNVDDLRLAHSARKGQHITFTPSSPTFTAVDAVLPGRRLANFTIDLKHELKMTGQASKGGEGVALVADALGISGEIVFYWLLPRERFQMACKAKKAFPVTGQQPGSARTVRQFFVCVPFEFEAA